MWTIHVGPKAAEGRSSAGRNIIYTLNVGEFVVEVCLWSMEVQRGQIEVINTTWINVLIKYICHEIMNPFTSDSQLHKNIFSIQMDLLVRSELETNDGVQIKVSIIN